MLIINNLCMIYHIQCGTIFVKQNYFAHVGFINERRKFPLTTSRIANQSEEGGATYKMVKWIKFLNRFRPIIAQYFK